MSKKIIKRILLTVIVILILVIIYLRNNKSEVTRLNVIPKTTEEIYAITTSCILSGNKDISFVSTINPDVLDLDEIIRRVMKEDIYKGSELYSYSFVYSNTAKGLYDIDFHFYDPSNLHSTISKWRIKSIASHFEKLDSDYEKIRAVHDWLILANRYVSFDGGTFSATCLGRSSCTGYAFTFYLIMQELGIDCTVELGAGHAWNSVKLDGEWYNMDVTWDDLGTDRVAYTYFMKNNADFKLHDHCSATAEASKIPAAAISDDYYRMVPNFVLLWKLILAAIFVVPVSIFAIIFFKRERRKEIIKDSSGVTIGNWRILMPATNGDRLDIIIKKHLTEQKTETFGIRNETCFHELLNVETLEKDYHEISKNALLEEIRFTIMACRNADSAVHYKKESNAIIEELNNIMRRI